VTDAIPIGWDQRTISKIERGSKRVTVVEFVELAAALEFDAAAAIRRLERRRAAVKPHD
jgi:hypothetical protein